MEGSEAMEGSKVTAEMLTPGLVVLVPVGSITQEMHGEIPVISLAQAVGPVGDGTPHWWFYVAEAGGIGVVQQTIRPDEVLGVPTIGVGMVEGPRWAHPRALLQQGMRMGSQDGVDQAGDRDRGGDRGADADPGGDDGLT